MRSILTGLHKLEVIGVEKKVRAICVDEMAVSILSESAFGGFLRDLGGLEAGNAIGEPLNGAFGYALFRRLTQPLGNDLKFCRDEAIRRGVHESDKKSWEATLKIRTAHAYCIWLMGFSSPSLRKYGTWLADVLATYCEPIIMIKAPLAFRAPGRVPSGSKFTAAGNTWRHKLIVQCFRAYIVLHDYHIGRHGCTCWACDTLKNEEYFSKKIEEIELDLLAHHVLMGDDFWALWTELSLAYDKYADAGFGTVTESEKKAFIEDGQFLRREMILVPTTEGPMPFSTRRGYDRLIGKLAKGPSAYKAPNKMAQCISNLIDANNPKFAVVCRRLHDRLARNYGKAGLDDAMLRQRKGDVFATRLPNDAEVALMHLPTAQEIVRHTANNYSLSRTGVPLAVLENQKYL